MTGRSSFVALLFAGAVSLVASSAAAAGDAPAASAKEPSTADRERSRGAFRKGVAQLRAQDWAGARASFEEAWSLVQHPSILLNLGIARLKTDDPVLAEQDLVRFLSDDTGADSGELATAREALLEARAKIGVLRVVATPASAKITIDGKAGAVENKLKAGRHTALVEADGFASEQRGVDIPAKGETELKVALVAKPAGGLVTSESPPAREPGSGPSNRTIAGWSLAGLGGVALVASGIMAIEALGLSHDYDDPTSKSFQSPDVKSQGIGFRTGADLAFLAALLAGAGAYVLLYTKVGVPASRMPSPVLHW